jgi:YD repeat-containing protein
MRKLKQFLHLKRFLGAVALLLVFIGQSFAAAPGRTYLYDDEGRLIQVVISDGTKTVTIQYIYDAAGNLIQVTQQ